MKVDLYTKAVLTVIAAALAAMAMNGGTRSHAADPEKPAEATVTHYQISNYRDADTNLRALILDNRTDKLYDVSLGSVREANARTGEGVPVHGLVSPQ